MRYLIAYDIANDLARGRLLQLISGYGVRVQFSVFECNLGRADLNRPMAAIEKIPQAANDSVVAHQCGAVGQPKHKWLGTFADRDFDFWMS